MNKPRFLCDECQTTALLAALRQLAPGIDVTRIGDPGAPPLGTKDPALLIAAETLGRVLITNDRRTMPGHLTSHFASGRHTAGVILLRDGFLIGHYAQKIVDRWATTTADDWLDLTIYLP